MSAHTDQRPATEPQQETTAESVLIANRFILVDKDGRERVTLSTDNELAMLVFSDRNDEPAFSISISLDGFVLMSATYRKGDELDSAFSVCVANGEPELILKDGIFGDQLTITARGAAK